MFFVPQAVVQRLDFIKALHAHVPTNAPLDVACADSIARLLPQLTLISLREAEDMRRWLACT